LLRWLVAIVLLTGAAWAAWWVVALLTQPGVEVTRPVYGPVVQAFYANGSVEPSRTYPINSNFEGILTRVWVDKGDRVVAGQPLAFVLVDDMDMRLAQARAELDLKTRLADEASSPALRALDDNIKAAEEQLRLAQAEAKRIRDLVERNAANVVDLDRAADRVEALWSQAQTLRGQRATRKLELDRDVEVARQALLIVERNASRQTLRAPISGRVLDRPLPQGTRVKVNEPIMEIADVGPLRMVMRAKVDEEDKIFVRLGQRVTAVLYAFAGRTFDGVVARIYPRADPTLRTFEVDVWVIPDRPAVMAAELALEGFGPLRPRSDHSRFAAGMTAELAFITDRRDRAMVIPSQAVQQGRVYVVRDGRLEEAPVRLGLRSVERVEVLSGLAETDRVVISAVGKLEAGQRVRIRSEADPTAAANLNRPRQERVFKGFN